MAGDHASPPNLPPRPRAGTRWTSALGLALRVRLARRIRRLSDLRRCSLECGDVQRRTLRRLLERAHRTEIGRSLNFATLTKRYDNDLLEAYRKTVARADYESFREPLGTMREQARPDVLWPGVVRHWAQTSGTTGGQKYIPVSREMMRSNFRAALDIFAHASRFGVSLPHLFGGHLLFLGGSTSVEESERGIRTGDLSGLAAGQIRWPLNRVYSPGARIALMEDWPAKIDAMARLAMRQDIRAVSGMASWSLVLFERVLEIAREEQREVRSLGDVWPSLSLFIHGGVQFAPFADRIERLWSGDEGGEITHRLEVYPASEAFIAIQDRPDDPGLRLLTDGGNFFEFVPLEEIDAPDAPSFMCDEVETGQRYVVVLTTCAGLWRYVIGDVVEFDTVPDRSTRPGDGLGPPRLRIVGRHRHFINAFGENLIVEDIERAVVAARDEIRLPIGEFTAAPVYPNGGRSAGLELAVEIECKTTASSDEICRFASVFDRTLRQHNVDYDTKRSGDLGMAAATITPVPAGTFHAWMSASGQLGGQHKAPRCANHREILEAVLEAASTVPGEHDPSANR